MYWNMWYTTLIVLLTHRLTLTWDVLKFFILFFNATKCYWLTLTWDVLKFIGVH